MVFITFHWFWYFGSRSAEHSLISIFRTSMFYVLLLLSLLSATCSEIEIQSNGGSSPADMQAQHNLLFALYKKLQMPDKLTSIHQVVHHFDGRYDQMWNLLTTKYGVAVQEVLEGAQEHRHAPEQEEVDQKTMPKGTPTINTENPLTSTQKKLKEIDSQPYPWEEGGNPLSVQEQYAEMEQEIMDFYSLVEPKKMETTEKLVEKYFTNRTKLENILIRKYFRRSLYLWMRKSGGYKPHILDKKKEQLHHPDVVAAAADVSRRDLLASVKDFYRAIRPDLQHEHAKETVDRWSRFPSDLIERMVKKYMPTSGWRWLKRSHRREEKEALIRLERLKKDGGVDVNLDFMPNDDEE